MSRTIGLSALLLAALATAMPARANDSSAELRPGGLVFVPSDSVSMMTEDLFISMKEVKVRYVFRNTADKDVETLVAFPMPDIYYSESPVSVPFPEKDNFLDFTTVVNGKPVQVAMEQRVVAMGLDRTRMLQDLNIPLGPIWNRTIKALDALPDAKKDELTQLGLVRPDEYDAGKGMEKHLAPQEWTLKTTYYWKQVFPAKKDIVIEHRYVPSVGESVGTLVGMASKDGLFVERQRQMDYTYCIDSAFKAAVARQPKVKGAPDPALSEARIAYVLRTGANWFGPIGDFTLTVDKGAPENLVSFCATGVKKIGPTTFQMKSKEFYPERDLDILILKPYPAPPR